MATPPDDSIEIKNLDARLFEKSTCWYTTLFIIFCTVLVIYFHTHRKT